MFWPIWKKGRSISIKQNVDFVLSQTEAAVFLFDRGEKEKLQRALLACARAKGIPCQRLEVARLQRGKPYLLQENQIHFSVSHSGGLWGCAVWNSPVGFDLEQIRTVDMEEIACRFFHPEETDYVLQNRGDSFFTVWTAKESYVKYTGEGITESFREFSVWNQAHARFGPVNGIPLYPIPVRQGYRACICGKGIDSIAVIDWSCHRADTENPDGDR